MNDEPISLTLAVGESHIDIGCQAVSEDCIDGFLAVYEPTGFTPGRGVCNIRIDGGGVLLVDREDVVAIEATREYIADLLNGGADDE